MKPTTTAPSALAAFLLLLLHTTSAAPVSAPSDPDYTPPGGWNSIDYPPPPGGWSSLTYPPGTGTGSGSSSSPFTFTSTHRVFATPTEVVNGTTPTGGLPGAIGYYTFGLDVLSNTVCYNITLTDFVGDYASPAKTATHIHEAARGASGPPRVAFPNPVIVLGTADRKRVSVGCLTGPFETGVLGADGRDTGEGFHVSRIEEEPAKFFADVHSSFAVAGAVRGQLA